MKKGEEKKQLQTLKIRQNKNYNLCGGKEFFCALILRHLSDLKGIQVKQAAFPSRIPSRILSGILVRILQNSDRKSEKTLKTTIIAKKTAMYGSIKKS